jgi:hypothetical protein
MNRDAPKSRIFGLSDILVKGRSVQIMRGSGIDFKNKLAWRSDVFPLLRPMNVYRVQLRVGVTS